MTCSVIAMSVAATTVAALVPAAASEPAAVIARVVAQGAASCPEQIGAVEDVVEISPECGETRVGETLSEFATGYVTATGDLRMEYSTSAVRQDGDNDGAWAPVDVRVGSGPVVSGDMTGMLPVTGGVEPLWLNPGGAAGAGLPLVVLGVPEERVAMYSGSLSLADAAAGVVDDSGRRITYDFGGGVDLVVSVNADGTTATPVVSVADHEALDHLAGDLLGGSKDLALDFPLATADGLAVEASEAGDGFAVVDGAGEIAWESGPALMWDSAGATGWDGLGGDPAATGALSVESRTAFSVVAESEVDPTGHEVRLENPLAGDMVAAMDVSVAPNADGGVVTVVPDAEMLADPDLSMPLLLDPKIGAPDPAGWAMVQNYAAWKDTPSWNYSGSEGVGLCDPNAHTECTQRNVQRLLWRFSALRQGLDGVWLGDLAGSDVVRAEFAVNGTHSFDCDARSVDVYGVATYVGSGTVWDTVNWDAMQDRWSGTHRDGCGNRTTRAEFDVTARVRTAANADESWIAVGMRAADETSMNWWKRYAGSSGELSILFDRPPLPPTRDQTEIVPEAGAAPVDCQDWDHRVQVRDATPQLKARGSEPDGTSEVKIRFRVEAQDTLDTIWTSGWSAPAGATTWRSVSVPGSVGLRSGSTYRWRVQVASTDPVSDSTKTTNWLDSPLCFFTVDTQYPNPPGISSTGTYKYRQVAGGVGTPIGVRFSPNGSSDVVEYQWSFNSQSLNGRARPAAKGGSAELDPQPVTRPGLNYFAARSVDDAGLISDVTIYEFYVGFAFTTAKWQFNDTGWTAGATAASASNSENTVAGGLTASGGLSWTAGATPDALWPPDPTGVIANRKPDGAWLFNPDPATQDDVATSVKPVVNGTQSFTISAFLRADDVSQAGAAVTQVPKPAETVDGNYRSSFHLGFSKSQACPTETDPATVDNDPETETRVLPCWAFWHVRDNEPNSENVASRTAVPAIAGQWTHVVGVYDAGTESLQAWACPLFAFPAQRPQSGSTEFFEVDEDGNGAITGDETWTPWNVAGHLRLGSGMKTGTALWPFHGAVDEVRVAAGHIYDEDTLSAICRGADVP